MRAIMREVKSLKYCSGTRKGLSAGVGSVNGVFMVFSFSFVVMTLSAFFGLIQMLKKTFDFLHGDVVGSFQGTDAGVEYLAHLFVLHLLEVLHIED